MVSLKVIARVQTRKRKKGAVYSEWEKVQKKGLGEYGNREIQYIQSKRNIKTAGRDQKARLKSLEKNFK